MDLHVNVSTRMFTFELSLYLWFWYVRKLNIMLRIIIQSAKSLPAYATAVALKWDLVGIQGRQIM